jgi:NAD+ synthase (glutamine-hydrolysing)
MLHGCIHGCSCEKNVLPLKLKKKLLDMRTVRAFNPEKTVEEKCAILNRYMLENGYNTCTMSVSGDIYSAVIYGLCSIASKQPGSPIKRVVGVAQPVCTTVSIWRRALDLKQVFDGEVYSLELGELISLTQTKFFSSRRGDQSFVRLSNETDDSDGADIVRGPCKDDDGYMWYYYNAIDAVVDVQLIANLHESEVITVAREIKVPASILEYPKDAMWDGEKTAEQMLKVCNDFVELYSEYHVLPKDEQAKFIAELDPASLAMFTELSAKVNEINSYYGRTAGYPKNLTIIPGMDLALL